MAIARLTIAAGAIVAAALLAPASGGGSASDGLQESLAALAAGDLAGAERIAVESARANGPAGEQAWIIVAEARRRAGKFAQARQAYQAFLAVCIDPAERAYAADQIAFCTRREAGAPKSVGLSDEQRRKFRKVEDRDHTESTEHFVVRARNAELARAVAVRAERALGRICRSVLAGQEYPHSVRIYVWPTIQEYRKHAGKTEWEGGSFTLRRQDGRTVRRIDLTQLDSKGRFDGDMLTRILPHEMCHLVLTESFGDAACPLAIDEGLAMLAEEATDNSRVLLAGAAVVGDEMIPLERLLAMDRCDGDSPEAFYAEAFSLTDYLHSRLSAGQFREVLDHLRAGLPLDEAIQRALCVPGDDAFLDRLSRAWQAEAVKQAQFLRALDG